MMNHVEKRHSITEIMNPNINTISYEKSNELKMFPKDFFCAKNHGTGVIEKTQNTFCIHHFAMSWLPKKRTFLPNLKRKLMSVFGVRSISVIIKLLGLKKIRRFLNK